MGMTSMAFTFERLFRVYSDIPTIKGILLVFLLGILVIALRLSKSSRLR